MSAVFSGNSTPCNDFDINASELNRALADVEILNNGQLTLTKIDGTTFINNIPFFPDFVISGINLSIDVSPNADDLLYTSGNYQIDAVVYTLGSGGTINLTAGHATLPRVDIVYLDTSSNINYLVGTPSATPVPPTAPANTLVIAQIGVQPNANNLGGYTLTQVNINENNVSNGFLANQTLRWDTTLNRQVPNSNLLSSTTQVSIGTAPTGNALLEVDGDIQINDIAAPFPTTNKLYAIGGDIYQDGVQLNGSGASIAPGTVNGSHLFQNGLNWVEDTTYLFTGGTTHTFTTNFFNITETDFNLNTRNAQNNFNISSFRNGNQFHYFRLLDFLGGGVKNTFPGLEYYITNTGSGNESYLTINEYSTTINSTDGGTANYTELSLTANNFNVYNEVPGTPIENEFDLCGINLFRREDNLYQNTIKSINDILDPDDGFGLVSKYFVGNDKKTQINIINNANDDNRIVLKAENIVTLTNTYINITDDHGSATTQTIELKADNGVYINAPMLLNIQNINAAGVTIVNKSMVMVNVDIAGITINLHNVNFKADGLVINIKRDHATNINNILINDSSGSTIEGAASYNLTGVRESIMVVYNLTNNNWSII